MNMPRIPLSCFPTIVCSGLFLVSGAEGAASPAPDLDARFASTQGWLGADGIYSVALSNQRTAWIFSDTWTGVIKDNRRENPRMINNSVGITSGTAPARFFYPADAGGKAASLFTPPDGRGWFWPVASVLDSGVLRVFAWRIEKSAGDGAFGFKAFGTALAEIDNPADEPTSWRMRWRDVPVPPTPALFWGSFALVHEGYTYLYGYTENGGKGLDFQRYMILARAPAGQLGDFSAWRYYGKGAWLKDASQSERLCPGVACEYSVTYLPSRKRFLLVTHDLFLSPKIVARTSETPWGHWSDKSELFTCPEADSKRGVFCYAAKHQPAFSTDETLVISYAANGNDMKTVLNDPTLYVPRFIRVPASDLFRSR